MTALNQQVFPTLRMPTGQSSWRIQSVGLQASLGASHLFRLTLAPLSSALASRALADTQTSDQTHTDTNHRLPGPLWTW